MKQSSPAVDVYLIAGNKRIFASVIEWPGWCRSGGDEASALRALFDYGPRYERVAHLAGVEFHAPMDVSEFKVIERVRGGATADFGAPGVASVSDARPVNDAELSRLQALLDACWQAFDAAVAAAAGKELRKGPRGGGRDLDGMVLHVLESGASYLARLSWKFKVEEQGDPGRLLGQIRQANTEALVSAAHGNAPERGPRGGIRWSPRYFVRYAAWHLLDHTWEIEDRVF